MTERDVRLALLNTLLTTPHRDLASVLPLHRELLAADPRFYVRVAAWYADNGSVRDHQEMFVIMLGLSQHEGHRDAGLALLRRLPPYEVARVVDFIKGRQVKRHVPKAEAEGVSTRVRRKKGERVEMEKKIEQVGLFVNVPRSMRTEIARYLREREAHPSRLDSAILHGRSGLKRLYAGLHIKPSARAQAILFAEAPPEDSVLFQVKALARAEDPAEQARAIVEHKIPYRVAVSVIKQMSPTVLAALIDAMTPQEVINNVGALKRRGAFDNADVKALIEAKLEAAKGDKRVSAYKAKVAVAAAEVSEDVAAKLDAVTEAQVKAKGQINRATALLIDKSGSMSQAIEVGRQLGAMISAICTSDLFAYAFDTIAYPIEVEGTSLADWERALSGINANGGTSCGVALDWMRKKGQRVEQVIMVTDEGENTAPHFRDAYEAYATEVGVRPDVFFVKVGTTSDQLERDCNALGVAPTAFVFGGDYYALTNVIPLLSRPSLQDLLMEILEYPLPERKAV
ncbi:MAG TPA: hypothetical protein VGP82_04815 [Ktedonobacterales bacterium]|jgi:hypothetical protein|nr:hypothetical protein [Ktedonobacterales bacterium]